jgi:hypothetical protein
MSCCLMLLYVVRAVGVVFVGGARIRYVGSRHSVWCMDNQSSTHIRTSFLFLKKRKHVRYEVPVLCSKELFISHKWTNTLCVLATTHFSPPFHVCPPDSFSHTIHPCVPPSSSNNTYTVKYSKVVLLC